MAFALFLAYMVATFIRPFELLPELAQLRPMVFLGGTATLIALIDRALSRAHLSVAPQLLLILLLVLWASFTVLATQAWLTGAMDTFVALTANLFVFYLLVFNLDTLRRIRITLHVLTVLVAIVAIESISAYHFGYREEELIVYQAAAGELDAPVARVRHRGVLADPNDLAQTLIALMPFVFLARRPGATAYNFFRVWLPIAIMAYAVFLTRSRGGAVALMALVFLALRKRLPATWSLVLTAAGGTVLLGFGLLAGRAMEMDASAGSRTEAWRSGWAMLKSSPIWGVGYGYFMDHHERAAHNSYVQCFAEIGLVGYSLWLGTLVVTFWALQQVRAAEPESALEAELSRLAHAAVLSLIVFLVAAFFLSRTYQAMLFLVLGFATAVVDIARRRKMSVRTLSIGSWAWKVALVEVASIALLYIAMRFSP